MTLKRLIAALLALIICLAGYSQTDGILIHGDIPWVVSEADYENMPIQKAILDAERDWYKVFGYPPVIFHDKPAASWDGPVIIFGSVENTLHLIDSEVPEGKEQFRIATGQLKSNKAVTAIGSDTRGTIYAIYTFCEEVLGIDPMYIFTDKRPERKKEIVIGEGFDILSKKNRHSNTVAGLSTMKNCTMACTGIRLGEM